MATFIETMNVEIQYLWDKYKCTHNHDHIMRIYPHFKPKKPPKIPRVTIPVVERPPKVELTDEQCKSMLTDNNQMKNAKLCKICLDNPIDTIFLPCSHLVTCTKCQMCINECPICRAKIKATAKVYIQ